MGEKTVTTLTLKEWTKHIRTTLKRHKVKCFVRMFNGSIQVTTPTYEYQWSQDELRSIGEVFRHNDFTMVRNTPVFNEEIITQLSGRKQFDFYPTR